MPTRRDTMIGAASLLVGSGFLTSGAFAGGSTAPSADFRIIAPSRLVLVPGRDDHAHVTVESTGEHDQVKSIDLAAVSTRARTAFGHIVKVVNNSEETIDELYFKLEVESDEVAPQDIEDAITVISADASIPATGETNYLTIGEAEGDNSDTLDPGEGVPFGIGIDVSGTGESSLTDMPDPETFDITLKLSTEPAE